MEMKNHVGKRPTNSDVVQLRLWGKIGACFCRRQANRGVDIQSRSDKSDKTDEGGLQARSKGKNNAGKGRGGGGSKTESSLTGVYEKYPARIQKEERHSQLVHSKGEKLRGVGGITHKN